MTTHSPNPLPIDCRRELTLKERLLRQATMACPASSDGLPSCNSQVFVGLFFDGTGNNLHNDYKVPPPERRRHSNKAHLRSVARSIVLALGLTLPLTGCFEPEKTAVSYTAYNHTDQGITSIIIDGEGGILDAVPHVGGGEVCCVVIPKRWRPGLTAAIKWESGGHWLRDEKGQVVLDQHGDRVFVDGIWKEKIVPIEDYGTKPGVVQLHFFPQGKIRLVVSNFFPGHPQYPLVLPADNRQGKS